MGDVGFCFFICNTLARIFTEGSGREQEHTTQNKCVAIYI